MMEESVRLTPSIPEVVAEVRDKFEQHEVLVVIHRMHAATDKNKRIDYARGHRSGVDRV